MIAANGKSRSDDHPFSPPTLKSKRNAIAFIHNAGE